MLNQPNYLPAKMEQCKMETKQLNTKAAANRLGYKPYTLRRARLNGKLGGVEAPPYVKIGRRAFYRISDLDNWLSQFSTQTSTANEKLNAIQTQRKNEERYSTGTTNDN